MVYLKNFKQIIHFLNNVEKLVLGLNIGRIDNFKFDLVVGSVLGVKINCITGRHGEIDGEIFAEQVGLKVGCSI